MSVLLRKLFLNILNYVKCLPDGFQDNSAMMQSVMAQLRGVEALMAKVQSSSVYSEDHGCVL